MTAHAVPEGGGLGGDAAPPLPRRVPGQARVLWPGHEPGSPATSCPGTPARPAPQRASRGKPTPADLGIDLAAVEWECSGDGEGRIEVAFPCGPTSGDATWARGEWVLMRVAGDPARRVLVFDRNEWECFLDGARNGEFDDAV
jgi:hypothetical protein